MSKQENARGTSLDASDPELVREAAVYLGYSPDLTTNEQDNLLDEAEWALEQAVTAIAEGVPVAAETQAGRLTWVNWPDILELTFLFPQQAVSDSRTS